MTDGEAIARQLLNEEIERIVGDALANGMTLRTGAHAAALFASYPSAHFSLGHIVDELILAASTAKVAVEISRPDGGADQ